jgi:hypothetical protein
MALKNVAKFCILCILPLLWALPALTQIQMHGNGTSSWTFGVGDTTANCTTAGYSCWQTHSGGMFSKVIASRGQVVGIDSSGCASLYSDPMKKGSNSWTPQTAWGCGIQKVFYAPDGNIYAMRSAALCDGVHPYFQKLNGSTWVSAFGCGPDVSFDPAGTSTSVAIGTTGAIWISTNYWASGTQVNGCSDRNGAASVAMLGGTVFAVICNDTTIWYGAWSPGTATVNYVQLINGTTGHGLQVTGAGPTVWVIGTDGKPYRWRLDQDTSWHLFTPPAGAGISYLSYGDMYNVWASNGSTSRLTEWGIQASNTYNTSTTCTLNGQRTTCPSHSSNPPVQHTTSQIWHWELNGANKGGGSASVGPYDPSISQLLNTTGTLDDPVGCNIDFVNCFIGEDHGELDCSQDGELNAVPPVAIPLPSVINAVTHSKVTSGPPVAFGHLGYFEYPTVMECTPGTSGTPWNPLDIVTKSSNPTAFDSSALCISWNGGPYYCTELAPYPQNVGIAIADYGGTNSEGVPNSPDPGPQNCEY